MVKNIERSIFKEVKLIDIETLRRGYKSRILEIADLCHAENIRIFGSRVRGEEKIESDIDFLVHMEPDDRLNFCGLQWRLKELLDLR